MNFNVVNALTNMTREELESELLKYTGSFTGNESKVYEKGKNLFDEAAKCGPNDSGNKVFNALLIYYTLKNKK